MLGEVTLGELADLVEQQIVGGYESEKQQGRRHLRDVIGELRESMDDGRDQWLAARSWRLGQVSVSGIGGIATLDPGPLDLAPTRGLTLVRGVNGCGKTSLARAIECGLHGRGDLGAEVPGALWNAGLITDGADTATVRLSLMSAENDQLVIDAEVRPSGEPAVMATLTDSDGTRTVALDDGWRRALLGARVCYSYGALQNRLTQTTELQDYLEELLVLGPAWSQVRDRIVERAATARHSSKTLDTARAHAAERERELTKRYAADPRGAVALSAISWPRSKDGLDADRWLASTGLAEVSVPDVIRVADDHETRTEALRVSLTAADQALDAAEQTLESPAIKAALHHIDQIVRIEGLPADTCPVCGTSADWRAHARQLASGIEERTSSAGDVQRAVTAIVQWTESELAPLLTEDSPARTRAAAEALRESSPAGHHAHSSAHHHCRSLLDVVETDEYARWLEALRARSDATAEWRGELGAVVRTFAETLRDHSALAAAAGAWKKAGETLDELQVGLRQQRQDVVTEQLHDALVRMLPDAEIELTRINHPGGVRQQRGVGVEMTIGGRTATLGMLSSGQRNALLLAPLLILDEAPGIELLVVDDPVHALDDLRVDLLTRELARLAGHRQVVVMTHDARLEEYLRARLAEMTVIALERDAQKRSVTWSAGTPWDALLSDAREIRGNAVVETWPYPESVESIVAGLCRAAVDGALRQTVITRAVRRGDSTDEALATLEKKHETRKRVVHVLELAGGPTALPALAHVRAEHLGFWNQGSHGQLPAGVDLVSTIDAAEAACQELVAHRWAP